MTKKYLEELTREERTLAFYKNKKLQELILSHMLETEMSWITDQLDYLKGSLSDWDISSDYPMSMTIQSFTDFVDGVEEVEKDIPILIDEDQPLLEKAIELRDKYWNTDLDSEEFHVIDEAFENAVYELKERILLRWKEQLDSCYNEDNQLDYFLEFYLPEWMETELYVIPGDDSYIVYWDKTECFA